MIWKSGSLEVHMYGDLEVHIHMDFGIFICSKIMEFDLKWVHMARYELILKLDGALWLTIISKTPLTPRKAMEGPKNPKESV